jgi:hypothetical protein
MVLIAFFVWSTLAPWFSVETAPATFYQPGVAPRFVRQADVHRDLKVGEHFVAPDVYATDKASPPGRVACLVTGYVNPRVAGDYVLVEVAADFCGNVAEQRIIYHVK